MPEKPYTECPYCGSDKIRFEDIKGNFLPITIRQWTCRDCKSIWEERVA